MGKNSNGSLWNKVLEAQYKKGSPVKKQSVTTTRKNERHVLIKHKRSRRTSMKRRTNLEGSRRFRTNLIKRKVKFLKKLIPNRKSMGLDGLFKETADYILSLQMRVNLMQTMVKLLSDE